MSMVHSIRCEQRVSLSMHSGHMFLRVGHIHMEDGQLVIRVVVGGLSLEHSHATMIVVIAYRQRVRVVMQGRVMV